VWDRAFAAKVGTYFSGFPLTVVPAAILTVIREVLLSQFTLDNAFGLDGTLYL
jgi:hypothetical protein